jgi:hypothetical protein
MYNFTVRDVVNQFFSSENSITFMNIIIVAAVVVAVGVLHTVGGPYWALR